MQNAKGFLTIGYGRKDIKSFIQTLLKYRVNCLIDVRSSPYSKYNPEYNRENLRTLLQKSNICYEWRGECLGGRPEDLEVYDKNGIVDYEKLVKTKLFISDIEYLEKLCIQRNVVIMCSEEDALKCHRFLAISRELARRGYRVVHVKNEKAYTIQAQMEDRLIKECFGSDSQISLFDNVEQLISESYAKQNKKYGYRRKQK